MQGVEERNTRERTVDVVQALQYAEDQALVKAVIRNRPGPTKTVDSVETEKVFEMLELAENVVSSTCSLLAFFTTNTNAYIAALDHDHIVSTITNSKGHLSGMLLHQQ